ncbi:MAG: T9SS type A sorting domain-containing protein [Flavobacteriales bacterium]
MDGDGYKDALTLANHSPVWYKNQTYLCVEEVLQNKISMYPNLVENTLTIETNLPIEQFQIYDVMGKKVLEFAHIVNKQTILSQLKTGLYFMLIKTPEGVLVKKVVKN